MNDSTNKPIHKITHHGVSIAIFARTHVREDGSNYTVFSTVLERRYRDGETWRSTSSFSEEQLAIAADLITEARTFIRTKGAELRETDDPFPAT